MTHQNSEKIVCDLAVIGSGMAGMAASIFAAHKGLSTVCVGKPSEISFSSGCLDLFTRIPGDTPLSFTDPFKGIDALRKVQPNHPYGKVGDEEIQKGFEIFTDFMGKAGIAFECAGQKNQHIITPAGTLKSTFCVPLTMAGGTQALARDKKILIVDIKGLKGFGARQMAQNLKKAHPRMGAVTIGFPGREDAGDLMCERLTWDLETPNILERFIDTLRPLVKGYDAVGIPAILGIYRFEELQNNIEQGLGLPLFEIPTLSPSVTGMRTKEAFLGQVVKTGQIRHFPDRVKSIDMDEASDRFVFQVADGIATKIVQAQNLVLATGRFLGRGLGVEENRIKEMLLDLPVTQDDTRSHWFSQDFFDPRGHGVNRAGVETDACFRPLDREGQVVHDRLFVAGSLLAHQDWKRERSGAGISITSAYKAVSSIT